MGKLFSGIGMAIASQPSDFQDADPKVAFECANWEPKEETEDLLKEIGIEPKPVLVVENETAEDEPVNEYGEPQEVYVAYELIQADIEKVKEYLLKRIKENIEYIREQLKKTEDVLAGTESEQGYYTLSYQMFKVGEVAVIPPFGGWNIIPENYEWYNLYELYEHTDDCKSPVYVRTFYWKSDHWNPEATDD